MEVATYRQSIDRFKQKISRRNPHTNNKIIFMLFLIFVNVIKINFEGTHRTELLEVTFDVLEGRGRR